jgi:hypothetical protein
MRTIERTEGCYEVQDVEFGTVYRWDPETVVAACDCGQRSTLTRCEAVCEGCGADHTDAVTEVLSGPPLDDEAAHPWRHEPEDREDSGLPF